MTRSYVYFKGRRHHNELLLIRKLRLGIGLVGAKALAANGAIVYILGRRQDRLDEAAAACKGLTGQVIPLKCDTTDKNSLTAVAERVTKDQGRLDLLLVSAGTSGPSSQVLAEGQPSLQEMQQHFWDMDEDSWDDTFRLNVRGVFQTIAAFLTLLDEGNKQRATHKRQTSQIIVITALAGFHRAWKLTGLPYNLSKIAANHLVKNLAPDLLPFRIRINAIAPGSKFELLP